MIIIIGVNGAGKSMQGQLLARDLNCDWISTGELFRNASKDSKDDRLLSGALISDDETIEIVENRIKNYSKDAEFILDGFPRTLDQAKWLVSEVKEGRYKLTLIINLEASLEVVKERLLKRGREDDTETVIARRFDEFEKKTKPLIDLYHKDKLPLVDINADGTPEAIHKEILKHLEQ